MVRKIHHLQNITLHLYTNLFPQWKCKSIIRWPTKEKHTETKWISDSHGWYGRVMIKTPSVSSLQAHLLGGVLLNAYEQRTLKRHVLSGKAVYNNGLRRLPAATTAQTSVRTSGEFATPYFSVDVLVPFMVSNGFHPTWRKNNVIGDHHPKYFWVNHND